MKKNKGDLQALLAALHELRVERGERLYEAVRPLVMKCYRLERYTYYLENGKNRTAKKFVNRVARNYEKNGMRYDRLVHERSNEAWQELLVELQKRCQGKLSRKLHGSLLEDAVEDNAQMAALGIAQGNYYFDCSWKKWTGRIIKNVCAKGARSAASDNNKANSDAESIEDVGIERLNLGRTFGDITHSERLLDLRLMLQKVCTRDELIFLEQKYVYGLSDTKIGEMLGVSQPTISRMHKDLRKNLRGIL